VRVAIVGIGITPFRIASPEFSWKELMYDAATRAYADAGIDPRTDVDSFVTCAEDYWEGFGIFDEFTPDQLGAVLRPMHTVTGDGVHGLANAFMLIQSEVAEVVVVEAHSKASDIRTYEGIVAHALDPIWNRPLGGHPNYLAGLEMDAFLRASGNSSRDCAKTVAMNRGNALLNLVAAHGARITDRDVAASDALWQPLRSLDVAPLADGAVVLVLASDRRARRMQPDPVWIRGVGWATDSPVLETRSWATARYTELAAKMAYRLAKVRTPRTAFDVAEVDDRFGYKELEHLEAAGLARKGEAGKGIRSGRFALGGAFPVNASGGCLGCGNVLEASGLHRIAEVALQVRGEAGRHQVDGARTGVAVTWRGLPTASGGVAVLGVGA